MSAKIEERVEEIVRGLLERLPALELVDVEYVRERDWYLRVYIDKEGGIDIEDCRTLSEQLEEILDREGFITDAYILEVSSPGLDRVLRKPRDFERERGKIVDVTFYAPFEGKKSRTGALTGYDGTVLTLDGGLRIPMEQVSQVRLHIDF
ncbi:ribosome maturation factor RimP [Selenomonas sp. F0473]|uniref:ribosome maturation factor RimP n=1 Tax=Selenomonas sp. F0473 TaxID=999423 RepID=UPI0025FBDC86|nr:ribosome maturation factor RimP [Selenomonas sp. F0473]